MLKNIKIKNYALIENLNIDFTDGFIVLTGETGAGKSILMGALSLILGNRIDTKTILSGEKKCIVEVTFDLTKYNLKHIFDELELDYDNECFVRREILASGKSRAFINDTPVNLQQLKNVISRLIDIHSQHQNLMLNSTDFQLKIVDIVANNEKTNHEYKLLFDDYKKTKNRIVSLRHKFETETAEKDYITFQYSQLNEAQLTENEQDDLEKELNIINNSQEISCNISSILNLYESEEFGVLYMLKKSIQNIEKIGEYIPHTHGYLERLNSSLIDIHDIASELQNVLSNIEFSPLRKTEIEERLDTIYSLQQKHRVASISELLEIKDSFEQRLSLITNFDEELSKAEDEFNQIEQKLNIVSNTLSERRMGVAQQISQQIELMLNELGMPNAKLEVQFSPLSSFTEKGADKVEFFFSANKNRTPQSISLIASGGEISRLMLAIKSLTATSNLLPTIIFDEIDTGISGEVAKKMGEIMQKMAMNMQVISITHLPQIASKGKSHYKVFKQDTEEKTETKIIRLTEQQRIVELAEMMSGKNPSLSALNNAKDMLQLTQ
ncbi:MAG: DNA repair protein RecN [Bacteroidales bacterium]|nr:MAG: DNA repair protein RecN [Bacteroidales bacterium]